MDGEVKTEETFLFKSARPRFWGAFFRISVPSRWTEKTAALGSASFEFKTERTGAGGKKKKKERDKKRNKGKPARRDRDLPTRNGGL